MDVKLCRSDSKFKISTKAGPQACPKSLKFCLYYISLPTEGIVLKFFDMINIEKYGFARKFEI